MKSKSLETLLARESGLQSDMVTRFQKLRDSSLLSRSRGRNAEYLDTDEIVSGILSMVSCRPGFAALTAIGLRKLKPVGLPEDAFAKASSLAQAIKTMLSDSDLIGRVTEIRLGDSDPSKGMATTASITYTGDDGLDRVSQYVHETAVSLFQKGKEKTFNRLSLGFSVTRELVLSPQFLRRLAKEIERSERRKKDDEIFQAKISQ